MLRKDIQTNSLFFINIDLHGTKFYQITGFDHLKYNDFSSGDKVVTDNQPGQEINKGFCFYLQFIFCALQCEKAIKD